METRILQATVTRLADFTRDLDQQKPAMTAADIISFRQRLAEIEHRFNAGTEDLAPEAKALATYIAIQRRFQTLGEEITRIQPSIAQAPLPPPRK